MKGVLLLRQLQATGVKSPELLQRLVSSASGTDCRPSSSLNGGGVRGMAPGSDIMCGSSTKKQELSQELESRGENRKDVQEKRPTVVNASPDQKALQEAPHASSKLKWWRPDPATGTWVPEGYEGQVTTSTEAMKAPSRITRIRSDTTASLEEKRWWTSMEELPDMDRARDQ